MVTQGTDRRATLEAALPWGKDRAVLRPWPGALPFAPGRTPCLPGRCCLGMFILPSVVVNRNEPCLINAH